jgi:hypothetical protein
MIAPSVWATSKANATDTTAIIIAGNAKGERVESRTHAFAFIHSAHRQMHASRRNKINLRRDVSIVMRMSLFERVKYLRSSLGREKFLRPFFDGVDLGFIRD